MTFLLSRVIESQGQDAETVSIRDRVQLGTGEETSTQMVVFSTGNEFWFLSH